MTSRQRLNRVARGEIPDRVPIWPDAVFYLPMRLRYKTYNAVGWPTLEDKLACAEHFGFEKIVVVGASGESRMKVERRSWEEGRTRHSETVYHTARGERTLRTVHPEDDAAWVVEYPALSIDDVPEMLATIDIPETALDVDGLRSHRAKLGEDVCICGGVSGPLNRYMGWRGEAQTIMDMADDPGRVEQMLRDILAISLRHVRAAGRAELDGIFIGSNGLSLFSPAIMRRFVFPYLQKIAEEAHNAGLWVCAHHHGRFTAVLEDCAAYGPDILNPLERPPTGDVDLADAKRRIGDRLTLMGNVSTVTTLLRGTPEDVRNEVRECMDAAKEGGRFILSTSDQIARDTPFENIRAFVEAGIEFGGY